MPQFILEIPNCEETISQPIVTTALTRIIRTYKWYKEFDFKFLNLGESILVKGSEIDLPTQDRSQQRLTSDQTVEVEVSERYNEDLVRATHIRQRTEKNIFECDKTKTSMHPGYQHMIADITMIFRFRSRHSAENFRKRVRLATTKSVDGMQLETKYTYLIPPAYLEILKRIHTLMEAKHGYGISLGQWLKESFSPNLTVLANRSGGKTVLAMAEVNQNIIVRVQSPDEIDEKEKNSEEDSWSVTMNFELMYDRPDVMRIKFQHIINNQFLGMDIANRFKVLRQDLLAGKTHMAQLDVLRTGAIPFGKNALSGASSPIFDDWLPPTTHSDYPDVIRVMALVDENNPNLVLDLNDIADFTLTPTVKNWLSKSKDKAIKIKHDIFWIRVWAWDRFTQLNTFHLDENGLLTSELPLDPRINYHVTIGLCISPTVLENGVWDDLAKDRDMLDEWLGVIAPTLPGGGPKDVIDDFVKEYHDKYRDTSESPWHENDDDFDPRTDPNYATDLPPSVVDKIRKLITVAPMKPMKTVLIYGLIAKRTKRD